MPVVLYLYPGAGGSPVDGEQSLALDAVEHLAFRDHQAEFIDAGYSVKGISSQPMDAQRKSVFFCRLDHELLSDPELLLARALGLPTFTTDDEERWYERLTLIARGGVIERVFYPVAAQRSEAPRRSSRGYAYTVDGKVLAGMPAEPARGGGRVPAARLVSRNVDKHVRRAFLLGFGRRLRRLRTGAALTQDELAARCFLRSGQVSALERGNLLPNLETLLLLGDALGASVGEMADGLLAAPIHGVHRSKMLRLVAERPRSTSKTLVNASGLPKTYAWQILRYLAAYSEIKPDDQGWQLGVIGGERPSKS